MTIERARPEPHVKPWGVMDLLPWSRVDPENQMVGEISYARASRDLGSALQLKLLFTSQPLSIQVHPNDVQAEESGFERGKTEAWYVLKAAAGAKVALGLKRRCVLRELQAAAEDGSIVSLVDWVSVAEGDVVNVPAGTIHAIGSGLVIAEIQQRSDVTYRLFDHGRGRDTHIAEALAVSHAGPSTTRARSSRLSEQRQLLSSTPHFTFERITLSPDFLWSLDAQWETWLVVIDGGARAGMHDLAKGDGIFAEADHLEVQAGATGVTFLVAYASSSPSPYLLQRKERSTKKTGGKDGHVAPQAGAQSDRATNLSVEHS